jgi:hypothetical protein
MDGEPVDGKFGMTVQKPRRVGKTLVGERVPIILLSGMVADERLFEAQSAAFSGLRVQQPAIAPAGDAT